MFVINGSPYRDEPHTVRISILGGKDRVWELNKDYGVNISMGGAILRIQIIHEFPDDLPLSDQEKEDLAGGEKPVRIVEVIPWERVGSLQFEYPDLAIQDTDPVVN